MALPQDYPEPRGRWRALADLLRAAWKEYEDDRARYFAAAMVYYAFVSMVPLLLLLMGGLGLLLRLSELAASIEQEVLQALDSGFGSELRSTVEALLEQLEQESVVTLGVSLIGLVLTASGLFNQLRMTFRAMWRYAPPLMSGSIRAAVLTTIMEKILAFALVLAGGLALVAALALVGVMHWLIGLFGDLPVVGYSAAWLLALPSPIIVVAITFGFLFKFLPPVRLGWRHIWLATVLCTTAWIIGAEGLVLFGAFVGKRPSAWGAIGSLLVVMLWMKTVSQLLFFGAELCKVIAWREGLTGTQLQADRTRKAQ